MSEQQADVLRFLSKIDQARRASGRDGTRLMQEAIEEWGENATGLFGGQPLTGLPGRWADSIRERLRAKYRDARLHCLRQAFDDHQYDRVAGECLQLANEPGALYDEQFLELWMITTYRAGRRTEVAQIYQRATDSARTHLGSEFSDRLRRLAEIIRDDDHSKLGGSADVLDLPSATLSPASADREEPMSDVFSLMGGAADTAGIRFERRYALLALLDLLADKARFLQVEVPGGEGAGAEYLQVMADGAVVWHRVMRQRAGGRWTIASLAGMNVVAPWWPKIRDGGRVVFVSSTSAHELAELAQRASTAGSWPEFDQDFLASAAHRAGFERLRRAWGNPPGAEVYAVLRNIEVHQIGESDLKDLLEARIAGLVDGSPQPAMAVLEQFIGESAHRRLTAPDVWRRLAEHGLQPVPQTRTGGSGG